MGSPTTQYNFRYRNDNGSETAATWIAAINTNATLETDTTYRMRISVHGGTGNTVLPRLYRSLNSGTYTVVNASSNVVRSHSSAYVSDSTATTKQITTMLFTASQVDTADGAAASVAIPSNTYIEVEFCFQIRSADVDDSDTITLRVYNNTGALGAYTASPFITVNKPEAAISKIPILVRRTRMLGGVM